MRHRSTIPIIALVLLFPAWAVAQPASGGAPTMSAAVEQALAEEGGTADALDVMVRSGAEFERILVAEVTPDNRGVVAELGFGYEGRVFRMPIKLERSAPESGATWTVTWLPDAEYARALIAVVQAGPLPQSDNGDAWYESARLPALPVIVRADAVFTPFGRGALINNAESPNTQELMPPAAVAKAAQRWVGGVLADDPGPAAVDLMVDPLASWKDLSRVIMGASASGLFRLQILQEGPEQIVALSAAAPIFGSDRSAADAAPLVIAMLPHEDGAAFRVRIGEREYRPAEPCRPDVSFCADSPDSYRASLAQAVKSLVAKSNTNISYVMFAAGAETSVGDGLSYFQRTHGALGIPEGKVFLGYLGDEGVSASQQGAK